MSAISNWLPTPPDNFSTTLSSAINDSALTIPLNSVSGLGTEGVGVLFKKDADGKVVAGSIEFIHWTNVSGSNLTLTNTGDRGLTGSDSGAQAYAAGDTFEVWVSSYYYDSQRDGFDVEHATDGTHDATLVGMLAGTQTFAGNKTFSGSSTFSGTVLQSGDTISKILAPEGFLVNGLISVADAAGITVAIKGLDGNDPSATNPVYCRIGGTVRSITSALSVAKADGTNWCNSGSSELAAKEVDYFVYLGYNATDGVVIGFSRYPGASSYDDFSTTSTNEKYCAISTITNAAATDYYNVIGRFAATLSAGAGYTWTVPTFTAKNLIQRPIYETRWLSYTSTWSGWTGTVTANTNYRLSGNIIDIGIDASGTSNATTVTGTIPLAHRDNINTYFPIRYANAGTIGTTPGVLKVDNAANTFAALTDWGTGVWSNSGNKIIYRTIIRLGI